jgi:putative transcriptional regulator
MTIRVKLAVILAERQMKLKDLSEKTGISINNLSVLKTDKAKAIRFSTLNEICKALDCHPGEILEFIDETNKPKGNK